jgi:hypothetical protein
MGSPGVVFPYDHASHPCPRNERSLPTDLTDEISAAIEAQAPIPTLIGVRALSLSDVKLKRDSEWRVDLLGPRHPVSGIHDASSVKVPEADQHATNGGAAASVLERHSEAPAWVAVGSYSQIGVRSADQRGH